MARSLSRSAYTAKTSAKPAVASSLNMSQRSAGASGKAGNPKVYGGATGTPPKISC